VHLYSITHFLNQQMHTFYWLSSSSSRASFFLGLHPEGFLVGKCAFCSKGPAHCPHFFLLDPDETARAIWQAVRRLGWDMAALNFTADTTGSSSSPKVLLHAVNLRHGTDGFTSPPKEVVLRIFITLKNPSPSDWTREPWVQRRAR
jgi:hypothetical protein